MSPSSNRLPRSLPLGGLLLSGVFLLSTLVGTGPATAAPTSTVAKFHTAQSPVDRVTPGLTAQAPGQAAVSTLTPLAAKGDENAGFDTLRVSLSNTTIQDYWLFASGIDVTIAGMYAYQKGVVQDIAPDGSVKTLGTLQSNQTGEGTLHVRDDSTTHPPTGVHTIKVISAAGATGRATLTVTPTEGRTVKVFVAPATQTRFAWLDHPVTIKATGFKPFERTFFNLFLPDFSGYAVGETEALRADKNGTFTYVLRANTVNTQVGTWTASFVGFSGSTGAGTFAVTQGKASTPQGEATTSSPKLTADTFTSKGVPYTVTGFSPFEVIEATLRTPRGLDNKLGSFRSDGEGRFKDVLTASGAVTAGTYQLMFASAATGNTTSVKFVVTNADGSVPTQPRLVYAPKAVTRLTAIDPARGITVTATGFTPGTVVFLDLVNGVQEHVALASDAIAAKPADSHGNATFRVSTAAVPKIGAYSLTLSAFGGDAALLRHTLTVSR